MQGHAALAETVAELAASVDALAALAAYLRVKAEGLNVEPAVYESLSGVVAALVTGADDLPEAQRQAIIAMARTSVFQASELIDSPDRAPGWSGVDERLLQSIGQVSMGVAEAIRVAGGLHPSLGELLTCEGSGFVDVGTGAGWLAIAVARMFPGLRVLGIDVLPPALDLARRNAHETGLEDRIDLRLQDAVTLEPESADIVWLPMPFLPIGIVPEVIERAIVALRPGGWLLPGTFPGPGHTLPERLMTLRTLRAGGHPWSADELTGQLRNAGLLDPAEVPRGWPAPVRLYAGRKPGG